MSPLAVKGKGSANRAQAKAEAEAAGFTPAAPYPSATGRPWPLRCVTCNLVHERVTLNKIRRGYRCDHPYGTSGAASPAPMVEQRQPTTDSRLLAPEPEPEPAPEPEPEPKGDGQWWKDLLAEANLVPIKDYPGSSMGRWPVECAVCGLQRTTTLHSIRQYGDALCNHKPPGSAKRVPVVSEAQAQKEISGFGLEAMEPFPGTVNAPWATRCAGCHQEFHVSLSALRARQDGVTTDWHRRCEAPPEVELEWGGYAPDESYPGAPNAKWKVHCTDPNCGRNRIVTLARVRAGGRCHHFKNKASRGGE